ncbi:uncharacterized protein LOC111693661 [Trichogramma pretiosum]|uniref:uncharacterized protein LOC111693661 n=1 Tax=Trichogramma pretiosum TaxID=7493 RepID=UPI000C71BED7|nr:uncharacterized protein LOC111693661 [Trichogramma pretiosum]
MVLDRDNDRDQRYAQRQLEQQCLEQQRLEQQRLEQQRLEQQRLEQQRLEQQQALDIVAGDLASAGGSAAAGGLAAVEGLAAAGGLAAGGALPRLQPQQNFPLADLGAVGFGAPQVHRVAVRLPTFWLDKPAVWFAQAEAQFALDNITTELTKYYHVISQLDGRAAAEVEDIITNPPVIESYTHLRQQLIDRLSSSEEQRVRQLLHDEELGDRKPSQFLRHLKSLAGPTPLQPNLLRHLWLRRLPPHVQTVLTTRPELSLEQLSDLADKIVEISPLFSVHAVEHDSEQVSLTNDSLIDAIKQLTLESVAATDCPSSSSRLFVDDHYTKKQFLVDTGSDLCCFPKRFLRYRHAVADLQLSAANNSVIKTYGYINLKLNLGLRRDFMWKFIVADVSSPILGSDFLAHYHLLPDCRDKLLIDMSTGLNAIGHLCPSMECSVKAIVKSHDFSDIIADNPALTRPPVWPRPIKHDTVHHIRTSPGPSVSCRPRRLALEKFKIAKDEFDQMLQLGVCRPSESPWSSPLHLARKGANNWRPCGDFRSLNSRTLPDRYPVRHIHDFSNDIDGCVIFSTIDLVKAYQQIPVHLDDICKTAITTPFGLYEFPFMTFGLKNAGQTFQRFMDEVTRGLPFCYVYIDDILVYSRSKEEHKQHLRQLFARLHEYGLVLNADKCKFGLDSVQFLGYTVSTDGIRPPAERIQAIVDYPLPKTAQGLRRFIGKFDFYRRFIPHASELEAPLHDALSNPQLKGSQPVPWSPQLEESF